MIDTVKLLSPALPTAVLQAIELSLNRVTKTRLSDNFIEFELTSGLLAGSWDSAVSARVWNSSLMIEGSIHKAMLGHNVWGGPCDFQASCRWFINELSERLGVGLPAAELWTVYRVDVAQVFLLSVPAGVQEFMEDLTLATYPRRKVVRFGSESLFVPGDTTTIRVYDKGKEFKKHDLLRLSKIEYNELDKLLELAERVLRCEVQVKVEKFRKDFEGLPKVSQVCDQYLGKLYFNEVGKLMSESKKSVVKTHVEVWDRLVECYTRARARVLFGTWLQLSSMGDLEVRRRLTRRTYYDHKKHLKSAGVSWVGGDVRIKESKTLIPVGFSLLGDIARMRDIHPAVMQALAA